MEGGNGMATVMERGNEAPMITAGLAVATPARLTTTLYDLMAVVQDVVSLEDDTLVVATVVHLLRCRRCTWHGVTVSVAPLPAALSGTPGAVSRGNGPVIRADEDTDTQGENPW
jgi:hypothetical protein